MRSNQIERRSLILCKTPFRNTTFGCSKRSVSWSIQVRNAIIDLSFSADLIVTHAKCNNLLSFERLQKRRSFLSNIDFRSQSNASCSCPSLDSEGRRRSLHGRRQLSKAFVDRLSTCSGPAPSCPTKSPSICGRGTTKALSTEQRFVVASSTLEQRFG
jgi:hypothetical protein